MAIVYRATPRAMRPRDRSAQLHLPHHKLGHSRPNSSDLCGQAVSRGRIDKRSRKPGDCMGVPTPFELGGLPVGDVEHVYR